MQVVLLAAGQSSRFYPFTDIAHKSLVSIIGKTIIEHTLESIKLSGLKDVILVTGNDQEIQKICGDGHKYGVNITYCQQPTPQGMGDALLYAKEYIKDDFFLLNAYHVDFYDYKSLLMHKREDNKHAILLAQKLKDVRSFGIINVEKDRVVQIIEKPKDNSITSDLAIKGIYLLPKIFLTTLEQESSDHYSFEVALDRFSRDNCVKYIQSENESVSLKYPWDLFRIGKYILGNKRSSISSKAHIAKNAIISGHVIIEEGVNVMEGVCIKGPCYIGRNVLVGNNTILRENVIVESNCIIGANMEMKNSVVLEGSTTHFGYIGDSIIGKKCKIGGGFITGNVRLDRENIKVKVKGQKIETGLRSLGVITGSDIRIGINVSTMPGIILGNNCIVGPGTTLMEDVEGNTYVYTKHEYVRTKRE